MRGDQRLRRKSEFDAVFAAGVSRASGVLAVRALRRPDEGADDGAAQPCRFGFAISKRHGGAVVRNRIRRRLRASARRLNARGGCSGMDVVVIARTGAAQAEFAQLDRTLERLLRSSSKRLAAQAAAAAPSNQAGGDA